MMSLDVETNFYRTGSGCSEFAENVNKVGCYKNCIEVTTGRFFDIVEPQPLSVDILSIAEGLAKQCRFGGQTVGRFYSVAQHCCIGHDWAMQLDRKSVAGRKFAFDFLMHDAAEGYIGDLPRPVKVHLPEYKAIEDKIQDAITRRFAVPDMHRRVKSLDNELCRRESFLFMKSRGEKLDWQGTPLINVKIRPWGWRKARRQFLKRFYKHRPGEKYAN